jgi:ElaB/YqjD/DUF883 family membrane-anchored ribosome-binding protein
MMSPIGNAAKAGRMIQDWKASSEAVSEAWEDGREAVEHFIDKTRDRADELVHQAARQIKRKPLASLALAFGAGAVLGVVFSGLRRK